MRCGTMSNPFEVIFKKNQNNPWQSLENETIIIDPESQISFELNELGSFIWQRIDGQTELASIHHDICQEYDVTAEQALIDMNLLIDEMRTHHLIVELV